ncbi:MAG: glycosyltransferase family 39 protein [Bacillota bacterium]|nr:glycosyltransferase family 39 protein [Bacillota bacterium]
MFSLRNESRKIKLMLLIICGVFFVLCLLSIFCYGNSTLLGSLNKFDNDDVKYLRSGWILADGGSFTYNNPDKPTVFIMPALSYIIAFFAMIFGKLSSIVALRIFQAVLQTLCLLLIFYTARKIFNSKTGIAAVLLSAFYFADIYSANMVLTETIFRFLVLCLVYVSIYALEERKTVLYAAGGIIWGLAALFKPTIVLFPLLILIAWILKKYSLKEIIKYTFVSAVAFCIVLSPWWIRNYNVFHEFIPFTRSSGNPMLQGTYIFYNQTSAAKDGLDYSQFKYSPTGDESVNDKVETQKAVYRLKNLVPEKPLQYLFWYTFGKTVVQIGAPFYWKGLLGMSVPLVWIYHYLLIFLCIAGLILYYKKKDRNRSGTFLFSVIIYFIAVYLPFYAFSRYFYPAMPIVEIFAAYRLVEMLEKRKAKKLPA